MLIGVVSTGVPVSVGTEPTVSEKVWCALPSTFEAVISTAYTPWAVGVPDITPPELITTPAGAPVMENVGAGFADAVTT